MSDNHRPQAGPQIERQQQLVASWIIENVKEEDQQRFRDQVVVQPPIHTVSLHSFFQGYPGLDLPAYHKRPDDIPLELERMVCVFRCLLLRTNPSSHD